MPTRSKTSDKITSAPKSSTRSSVPTRTFTLRIPQNSVLVLVGALMVVSFLVGVLATNVSYKLNSGQLTLGANTANTGTGTTGAAAAATPAPGAKVDVSTGHLPIMGDKNAKVTVIEFADFQCPFCEQWFTTIEPSLIKDYVNTGKVQFYFRHYAFLGQESTWAAEASECANDQGKFWDYHDYLYSHQGQENSGAFTKDKLEGFASDMGLDTSTFNDCLESDKYAKQVTDDQADGTKAGVTGTPATFIDGQMISGAVPYDQIKSLIDAELAK